MFKYIALLLMMASPVFGGDPEAATVWLDGCTGVVVSPGGLILTADHCGKSETVSVRFANGDQYTAKLQYRPPLNGIDEAQTYQIQGESGPFPYLDVATNPLRAGDPVWSVGYPAGKYQQNRGEVVQYGFTTSLDSGQPVSIRDGIVTNWSSSGGNSGGPLLTENNEVIGLLSMTGGGRSYWIGLSSIKTAMGKKDKAEPYYKRKLVMFSTPGCGSCNQFEYEIRTARKDVLIIKTNDPGFDEWHAAYKKHTGKTLTQFPTFWVENTKETRTVAYEPGLLGKLFNWLSETVDGIGRTIFGSKTPSPQSPVSPRPPPSEDAPPVPIEEIDPANITIVIPVAMQDLGAVKGTAAKIAISKASGPLERAVSEKIGDKASLVLVFERTQPKRFSAVVAASKVSADPAHVLVLVAKQSLGIKTLIAGRVESAIVDKIPEGVPVELIFERVHPTDFSAIHSAILTRETINYERTEPLPDPVSTEPVKEPVKSLAIEQVESVVAKRLAESDNTVLQKVSEMLDQKPSEEEPVSNSILAILMSTLGAGWAGERGLKAYRVAKAAKAVVAKVKK